MIVRDNYGVAWRWSSLYNRVYVVGEDPTTGSGYHASSWEDAIKVLNRFEYLYLTSSDLEDTK